MNKIFFKGMIFLTLINQTVWANPGPGRGDEASKNQETESLNLIDQRFLPVIDEVSENQETESLNLIDQRFLPVIDEVSENQETDEPELRATQKIEEIRQEIERNQDPKQILRWLFQIRSQYLPQIQQSSDKEIIEKKIKNSYDLVDVNYEDELNDFDKTDKTSTSSDNDSFAQQERKIQENLPKNQNWLQRNKKKLIFALTAAVTIILYSLQSPEQKEALQEAFTSWISAIQNGALDAVGSIKDFFHQLTLQNENNPESQNALLQAKEFFSDKGLMDAVESKGIGTSMWDLVKNNGTAALSFTPSLISKAVSMIGQTSSKGLTRLSDWLSNKSNMNNENIYGRFQKQPQSLARVEEQVSNNISDVNNENIYGRFQKQPQSLARVEEQVSNNISDVNNENIYGRFQKQPQSPARVEEQVSNNIKNLLDKENVIEKKGLGSSIGEKLRKVYNWWGSKSNMNNENIYDHFHIPPQTLLNKGQG
jgi:hypothetical protein